MQTTAGSKTSAQADMQQRIVRYADLVPCYNAFVDTRTPGSEAKENFSIIGPGVSENPAQHVHIAEPHGFNIGGARQPPHCVNSQHSHDSAEVFAVMNGNWRFDLGEDGTDAQVALGPGDLISLPVRTFRGFTNIGSETAYLFAVLGNDDPGRVIWAPQVFSMARDYGLVLLETGRLVDTAAGERLAAGMVPMTPTSAATAATMRRVLPREAEAFVMRASSVPAVTTLIGDDAPIDWPHGFAVTRAVIAPGGAHRVPPAAVAQVVFVQAGSVNCRCDGQQMTLTTGDTFTVPRGHEVAMATTGGGVVFLVRGDAPVTADA